MKTRLLIFHQALAPYSVDLFNALARRFELRVVFLLPNLLSQKFDQDRLRQALIADHGYLESGIMVRTRIFRFGLHREIRGFRPDVVVTPEFSPMTLSVLALRTIGRCSARQVVGTDDNPATIAIDTWVRKLSRRIVLPRVQGLVVNSHSVATLYRDEYGFRGAVGVCPNLQDESSFRARLAASQGPASMLIGQHGLAGKKVVLYVGRLSPEKRVSQLLTAFAEVSLRFADTTLVVVGDGSERPALEDQARSADLDEKVIFVGRKEGDDLLAWYRLGSVFALVSAFETFGAVVNEALLAGIPVVCTDRAGASTLITEGKNGSVVDPDSQQALAEGLSRWLTVAQPLTSAAPPLRPCLMRTSFAEAVDGFGRAVESAGTAANRRFRGLLPFSSWVSVLFVSG